MSHCGVLVGATCQPASILQLCRPVRLAVKTEKTVVQFYDGFHQGGYVHKRRGRESSLKLLLQMQERGPQMCHAAAAAGDMDTNSEDWGKLLPDKKVPLYSHSLPSIEAWLKSLGFFQSTDDRALWLIQRPDWHAQLSLDVTDLYIRYLKSGPGNLERDVERKFSYALSREDIENAILGGP